MSAKGPKPLRAFILAGEASGDLLGGPLMQAMQRQAGGSIEFTGVGGERMVASGLNPIYPMSELSVLGIVEVLRHLPRLWRRLRQTINFVTSLSPDVVITIDAPDFSFRLAKRLRKTGIPHIHYTPPTVWAWRPGRARKIAKFLDHLLAILPFEPPYFEKHGLPCSFVGHVVTEFGIDKIDRQQFRDQHGIDASVPMICMLPGSRWSEVDNLLPIFHESIKILQAKHPKLQLVVPTVSTLREMVEQIVQKWDVPTIFVEVSEQKYAAMRASNVALAASGTVNLELATARTPFVITYKVSPVTAWLARRILTVSHVTMTNIISGRTVVPELLQGECRPDRIAAELDNLLNDPKARETQIQALDKVARQLANGDKLPSDEAAKVILDMVGKALQR